MFIHSYRDRFQANRAVAIATCGTPSRWHLWDSQDPQHGVILPVNLDFVPDGWDQIHECDGVTIVGMRDGVAYIFIEEEEMPRFHLPTLQGKIPERIVDHPPLPLRESGSRFDSGPYQPSRDGMR